jgi:PAS domain S-box-containing protein
MPQHSDQNKHRNQDPAGAPEPEIAYKQLAEQSFVGVYISQDGKFRYANPRMAEIFGYTLDEFIGRIGPEQVVHPADWPEIRDRSKKRLVGEIDQDYYQFRGIKKDRSVIFLEVYGSAVSYNGKRAVTGVVNDITSKVIAKETLQRELEHKNDFITIVAHELRTPLQPIYAYLDLMLTDPELYGLTEVGKKTITQLKWSVDREVSLVNRIFDLSLTRIEREKVTPVMREFSPHHLVELILRSHKVRSDAEIENTIPEDFVITSDIDYVYGIFSELISNAVQYSDPLRKISIAFKQEGDFLKFFVKDNGIGIAAEDLDNIFRPFYIHDSPQLSRKYGRLGLGLTLAKERAELLGGEILVESQLGKGSTFIIKLPKNRK